MSRMVVVDNGTRHLRELTNLLEEYKPKIVKAEQLVALELIETDLVILTGSHKHAIMYDLDYYRSELDLIKSHKGPILGICLGAELIAFAFGAQLTWLPEREHGVLQIKVTQANNLFSNLAVYESHRWAIKSLPASMEELARSKDGVEAFCHKSRPLFGLQFHPEAGLAPEKSRQVLKLVVGLLIRT